MKRLIERYTMKRVIDLHNKVYDINHKLSCIDKKLKSKIKSQIWEYLWDRIQTRVCEPVANGCIESYDSAGHFTLKTRNLVKIENLSDEESKSTNQ